MKKLHQFRTIIFARGIANNLESVFEQFNSIYYYLELVLNSVFVQMQIQKQVGGSVIIHWKPSDVMKILIPRVCEDDEMSIDSLVEKSHTLIKKSREFVEDSKKAVELMIENSEAEVLKYLKNKVA